MRERHIIIYNLAVTIQSSPNALRTCHVFELAAGGGCMQLITEFRSFS